ncbi:MFS transporter [Zavarzinia compransoris]|uniref:MFS transporter n=1 Tax=Zavarzinia marina TaxID=2911065 RepID=UPI001F36DD4E|nr:MFS transporter [Zavarzinia marina]MCF4164444.1 MFS transporter [Zavarzinia marina]
MSDDQPLRALHRQPAFASFWIARVLGSLGFQMSSVAFGWLIYELTGSAYLLGFAGLAQFLPMVVLTFVVGTVADRFERRRIVLIAQVVQAATLALMTLGILQGWLGVTGIFAGLVVLGSARTFERPAMQALLPALVTAADLPRAVAISSSAMQAATIVGPALGGLLGAFVPLALSAAFFAGASFASTRLRGRPQQRAGREAFTLAASFSGLGFIRRHPVLYGAISLDMVAVLLGGFTALLPIFARDILETGPWGLGLLRTAPAVGALLMAWQMQRLNLERGVGLKMFAAVIVFGVCTVIFALSESLVLSLITLIVLGAADNVSVVIRQTLVQLSTPDEMRGRVSAVNSLFIGASNQLGEFESGITAGWFGVIPAAVIGGLGTIAVALAWMRLFPGLRHARSLR